MIQRSGYHRGVSLSLGSVILSKDASALKIDPLSWMINGIDLSRFSFFSLWTFPAQSGKSFSFCTHMLAIIVGPSSPDASGPPLEPPQRSLLRAFLKTFFSCFRFIIPLS